VAGRQPRALFGLGLLHLHDQLAGGKDRVGVGVQRGPGGGVVAIVKARARPGPGLHTHPVARTGQLGHALGRQAHAELLGLDLGGNADLH